MQKVGLEVKADLEKFIRGLEARLALVAVRVAADLVSLFLSLVCGVDDVVRGHDFPGGNDARHGPQYVNHHRVRFHAICNLQPYIIREQLGYSSNLFLILLVCHIVELNYTSRQSFHLHTGENESVSMRSDPLS
jgi:hypothetical protein